MQKGERRKESRVVDLDPNVKLFIVNYLNPKVTLNPMYGQDHWNILCREAENLDWAVVHDLILRLDYENYFLWTLYWRIVADKVKARERHSCQKCGGKSADDALEAHHKTYEHHGSEHLHLDDLQTLCSVCHCVEHGLLVQAAIREWEANQKNQSPLSHLDSLFVFPDRGP
jgi:hypothetical protein